MTFFISSGFRVGFDDAERVVVEGGVEDTGSALTVSSRWLGFR